MNHDPTGLQNDNVPPLPQPCLPTLIGDNPKFFVDNLPKRFSNEDLGHRAAKVIFIAEVVCLHEYGKAHPEIYTQVRNTEYFRKSVQKYNNASEIKLLMFHMMQPKSKVTRDRAGKYAMIGTYAINQGCGWHQVTDSIKSQGGIEKTYLAATAQSARDKKGHEGGSLNQEALSDRKADTLDAAGSYLARSPKSSRRSGGQDPNPGTENRKPRFSGKLLERFLLLEHNSLTLRAVRSGGFLRLLVKLGPKNNNFRDAMIINSRFKP